MYITVHACTIIANKTGLSKQYPNQISSDSIAYEKMVGALTKKSLMNGIKQASPIGQTSCLEGFHSVLNQFSPKMIGYSYPGMLIRYGHFLIYQALQYSRLIVLFLNFKQFKNII